MNIIDDYSASSSDSDSNEQNAQTDLVSVPMITPTPEVARVIPKSEIENSLNKVSAAKSSIID